MKSFMLIAAMLIAAPAMADPVFPERHDTPVLDAANIIPDDQEAAMVQRIRGITVASKHQIMVLTVPSLQGYPRDQFGTLAFRHYGIGSRDADDGILITVAPNEKKAQISTGKGMGSIMTDADSSWIVQRDMIPFFKNKDWVGGINAGIDKVAAKITPPSPEQVAIAQRAAEQAAQRREETWNSVKDGFAIAMTWFAIFGAAVGSALGAKWLVNIPKRRREKEEAEAEAERQRLADIEREKEREIAAAKQAEQDRLDGIEREKERERQRQRDKEARKREAERVAKAAKDRADMLAAMSPVKREAFLQKERDEEKRRAEAEENQRRKLAEQRAEEQRERDRVARERAIAYENERAAARKRQQEREQQEEEERRNRSSYTTSSWGSSSWGSSSSSDSSSYSSSSDSFSGGSSDGGGGGGDW